MLFEDYIKNVKKGFELKEKDGVRFLTVPSFDDSGIVRCAFSTRIGGVSKPPFDSLNFSLKREGIKENFIENFKRICGAADVDYTKLTLVNYAHGDGIHTVEKGEEGKGLWRENDIPKCDALIIDKPGTAGATMHADCVPVFVLDTKNKAVCISHAGWRGVAARLPGKIIKRFKADYNSKSEHILTAVGPHIMSCCFEVQSDVADIFNKDFTGCVTTRCGKMYVDMQRAILQQFYEEGIPAENVTCANLCTSCHDELFYSHRRDKGKTGAMCSIASLR